MTPSERAYNIVNLYFKIGKIKDSECLEWFNKFTIDYDNAKKELESLNKPKSKINNNLTTPIMNLQDELKKFNVIENALANKQLAPRQVKMWMNRLDNDFEGTKSLIEGLAHNQATHSSEDFALMDNFSIEKHKIQNQLKNRR